MGTIKGQNLRVFIGSKCVAKATNATFHVAAQMEDSSTKDSGDWQEQEVTGLSWDAQTESLVTVDTDATGTLPAGLMTAMLNKTKVQLTFDQTDPTSVKNRTPVSPASSLKKSGYAYIADLSISAQNRANGTISVQFQGTGALS